MVIVIFWTTKFLNTDYLNLFNVAFTLINYSFDLFNFSRINFIVCMRLFLNLFFYFKFYFVQSNNFNLRCIDILLNFKWYIYLISLFYWICSISVYQNLILKFCKLKFSSYFLFSFSVFFCFLTASTSLPHIIYGISQIHGFWFYTYSFFFFVCKSGIIRSEKSWK